MANDLLELIRQKQARVGELRKEIEAVQQELDEARSLLSGGPPAVPRHLAAIGAAIVEAATQRDQPQIMGEGSSVTLARAVLRQRGRPMHAQEIVAEIERRFQRRVLLDTLVGNISRMIKSGRTVFVRTGPNTYGLGEWKEQKGNQHVEAGA